MTSNTQTFSETGTFADVTFDLNDQAAEKNHQNPPDGQSKLLKIAVALLAVVTFFVCAGVGVLIYLGPERLGALLNSAPKQTAVVGPAVGEKIDETDSRIIGICGLTLGQSFDAGNATFVGKIPGGDRYRFTPDVVMPGFERYGVLLTPVTLKVSAVELEGDFDTREAAIAEGKALLQKLEEKYGPQHKGTFDLPGYKFIFSGPRAITLDIREEGGRFVLRVRYLDLNVCSLAGRERLQS